MRKNQQEELRRLEDALMETEFTNEVDALDKTWQSFSKTDYDVYNTDHADVDMDAYSEEVSRGRSGNALSVFLTMVGVVILSLCILILLKLTGVL